MKSFTYLSSPLLLTIAVNISILAVIRDISDNVISTCGFHGTVLEAVLSFFFYL